MIQPIQSNRSLECDLTDDEVAEHAANAGELEQARSEHEAEEASLKDRAKASKEAAAVVDRDIRYDLRCVRTRKEYRQVDCVTEYDPDTEKMVTARLDTGAIIDSRPLYENERQGVLAVMPGARSSDAQDEIDREPAGA